MISDVNYKRYDWIDNAKAIGIVLIVLGHTFCLDEFTKKIIYSFHVPLFFYVSGFLLNNKTIKQGFSKFFLKYFKRLVVPYFTFGIISYFFWLPTRAFRRNATEYLSLNFYEPIIDLVYGAYDHIYVNEPLWFLTCLFSALMIFFFISKVENRLLFGLAIIILGILGPLIYKIIQVRLPWNIELATVAVVFIGVGHISKTVTRLYRKFDLAISILLIISALMVNIYIVDYNGSANMNHMFFGKNLLLYYITAFLGIIAVICISKHIPNNGVTTWLSKNSLIIFATHKIALNIVMGFTYFSFKLSLNQEGHILLGIIYTIFAILICSPGVYILNNYLPWIIGKKITR